MKRKALCILFGLAPASLMAADVSVTSDITVNTTWTASNTYLLDKPIFITNGATLTIEPGTLILGEENTTNETFGSLIATRGSKLVADGTKEAPIVFTARAERDGIDGDPEVKPDPAFGDASFWGGVILLGNAPINNYVGSVNTGEAVIEGFPTNGDTSSTSFGGSDPTDNSGILRYVSIRFGGFEFQPDEEINGLTLGGVGNGTTIDYVEIVSNSDDGVEFFGGTVNTKHIAVAFCQDECFDIDQGQQGYHQFWFGIQNADPLLGDFGGEWDGGKGDTVTGTPYTTATIYNMTLIGTGATTTGSVDDGINLSDNFAGTLANSLVHDFNGAALTTQSDGVQSPKPTFNNNTWGVFGNGSGIVPNIGGTGSLDPAGSGNSAVGTDPDLGGISRIPDGGLDPRPNASSPLYSSALADFPASAPSGFFDTVNYRGAFGSDNWLDGWTYLSQNGYLGDLADVPSDTEIPEFVDTDSDGMSDFLEDQLSAYGFDKNVSQTAMVSSFLSGQGFYTTDSIQELATGNQMIIEASGSEVNLTLPVYKSSDLEEFTPAGDLELTLPKDAAKQFYRIQVGGAE
ncbi:hypothetical protein JIN85_17415 [Luteolibacter pohnpeiensis]|uniref:T9SS C-terminal target domain-containing protein n=1 Tax=Luteolibacter pohnpeiensis TaxID=454153 RepID=A0A934SDM7_9BACT|nr:hypothetical protein [Luteolibacter pohnpeiensis]MBK1884202.1 hypothetical protein [Luteolibacter pohnpeiensis]